MSLALRSHYGRFELVQASFLNGFNDALIPHELHELAEIRISVGRRLLTSLLSRTRSRESEQDTAGPSCLSRIAVRCLTRTEVANTNSVFSPSSAGSPPSRPAILKIG
jgi:hypothetical protein